MEDASIPGDSEGGRCVEVVSMLAVTDGSMGVVVTSTDPVVASIDGSITTVVASTDVSITGVVVTSDVSITAVVKSTDLVAVMLGRLIRAI